MHVRLMLRGRRQPVLATYSRTAEAARTDGRTGPGEGFRANLRKDTPEVLGIVSDEQEVMNKPRRLPMDTRATSAAAPVGHRRCESRPLGVREPRAHGRARACHLPRAEPIHPVGYRAVTALGIKLMTTLPTQAGWQANPERRSVTARTHPAPGATDRARRLIVLGAAVANIGLKPALEASSLVPRECDRADF
jgi:hypothetical protein